MENAPVIAGLLAKRATIESEIAELEREIRRHRSELMQIDATILLFAPNLRRAKRDVTRFQRSAHFMTGELTRRCQTAFREAKGRPITADEIAEWAGPAQITPANLAPAGAPIAAAPQGTNQLDAFVVGDDGAAHVSWVVGGGQWAGPAQITPAGEAPPGACVSAAHQNDQQLDVFYVANDGAVHVTWVVGGGPWAAPARISPLGIAIPGSCVAAIKRPAGNQMIAFVTGDDGSLWSTWEDNDGRWHDDFKDAAPWKLTQAIWMRRCWWCRPHIHGSPVYAAFPNDTRMLYVCQRCGHRPEKDHLKAWRWTGDRVDHNHPVLGTDKGGALVLAPPGPPWGMPGGTLAVSVNPSVPNSGVLFASIARPEGDQMQGMLRAFDPFTLKELWNNAGTDYMFVKFVPPTIAGGKIFLPTLWCALSCATSSAPLQG